jgi:hypothetical protein
VAEYFGTGHAAVIVGPTDVCGKIFVVTQSQAGGPANVNSVTIETQADRAKLARLLRRQFEIVVTPKTKRETAHACAALWPRKQVSA